MKIDQSKLEAAIAGLIDGVEGGIVDKSAVRIGTINGLALQLVLSGDDAEMDQRQDPKFQSVE